MQEERSTAAYAALNQRVVGLENDVQGLRSDLSTGLSSLRADFMASFNQVNAKLDSRDDKKWLWGPAVGLLTFAIAVVGGLGTMALLPISKELSEAKAELRRVEDMLTDRDRRIWDAVLKQRSEFDYMRGQFDLTLKIQTK